MRASGLTLPRIPARRVADNTWFYIPGTRRQRRLAATTLSDVLSPQDQPYASNLDPDSYFGFMAKIENYNYKILGLKPMLACMRAENSPAKPCPYDSGRTICPENWEMRQLYVVEATEKPRSWTQKIGSEGLSIPRRILYIDSEEWLISASDQYGRDGQLWKTIATFHTYPDRPEPALTTPIYP